MACPEGIEPSTFSFGGMQVDTEITPRNNTVEALEELIFSCGEHAELAKKLQVIATHCISACSANAPQADDDNSGDA